MKLHRAIYRPDIYPFVTIFDASKAATAEQLGIPYAPKLAKAMSTNNAIASVVEFQNGVPSRNGGPTRFQPGLTSYGSQTWSTYSPIAEVTWAFFDCNQNGKFVRRDRNVSYGAVPKKGSKVTGFDPADALRYQPFGMDDEGVECFLYAAKLTGPRPLFFPDGTVFREELQGLIDLGAVFVTPAPAGWSGEKIQGERDLQGPLLVNAPSPVTVRPR
jgi:hypothetical protein